MTAALMVPIAAPAVADVGPGGPVLEPEIVLAEGLSGVTRSVNLLDATSETVLYQANGDAVVAYGPGLAQTRVIDLFPPSSTIADDWVVSALMDSVDIQSITDGARFTHPIPEDSEYIAPTANGWLELATTTSSLALVEARIAQDGTVTRFPAPPFYSAAPGQEVTNSSSSTAASVAGDHVAVSVSAVVSSADASWNVVSGLMDWGVGGSILTLEPMVARGESWTPLTITDDTVVATTVEYRGSSEPVHVLRRYDAGVATSSLDTERLGGAIVVGADVLAYPRSGSGWARVTPAGLVPAPPAWNGLPQPTQVMSDGTVVYHSTGDSIVRSDATGTLEAVLVAPQFAPLDVRAVDLEAGTAVWVDDSVAVRGSGTAWSRSLTLDGERSLLVERATGSSIKRMQGTTFAYRTNDDGETFDVVRADGGGVGAVVTARTPERLTGESRFLHVGDVFNGVNSDAIVDLATGAVTPSVDFAAISDTWRVSQTFGWTEEPSTVTATHAITGATRTFAATAEQPFGQGIEIVGAHLFWFSSGTTGTALHAVDLSTATSAVQDFAVTGDYLVAADRAHVAVSRWLESGGQEIDVYRLAGGDLEPVATLAGDVGPVAIDGGRVLWVEAGPDGDRLVAARIPGASLFHDVPAGAPFVTEIEWLVESGIGTGYVDGSFRPSGQVSRQAMAAFLFRNAGAEFTAPAAATFSDVGTGSPFFREIEWMVSEGLASVGAGTFRPRDQVSRQAMAAFLYRAAGSPEFTPPATASFADVPVTAAFFTEIEWLAQSGVTSGYGDGTFRPGGQVSRQAMAAFLHRFDALGK